MLHRRLDRVLQLLVHRVCMLGFAAVGHAVLCIGALCSAVLQITWHVITGGDDHQSWSAAELNQSTVASFAERPGA